MFSVMTAARASVGARTEFGSSSRWIDRWLAACRDLAELERSNPMTDAVVEEIDGRMIRIGDQWLADFASCNYLGFDLDREIIDSVAPALDRWGTHPSWSRLLGSPVLYEQIEERLTELVGAEDVLVLPTITLIHMSVIPVLAGDGTIYVDGVNSMTGNAADIEAMARLARAYDALLYVDDAHGFGVIGERSPTEPSPYGLRGNGVVKHVGESYDHVLFVAGLSKAYSSLAAFLACPSELKRLLKTAAPPYLYSGPSPIASLATTLAGLHVNEERGDAIRAGLWQKTATVLECLDRLGAHTPNNSGFPIIEVPLGHGEDIDAVGRFLFENGIYVTLAAYPLVPRSEVGFRIQITAANTDAEIERLVDVLGKLANSFDLQPSTRAEQAA